MIVQSQYVRIMDPSGNIHTTLPVSIPGGISVTPSDQQTVTLSGSIGGVIPVALTHTLAVALSGSIGGILPVAITHTVPISSAVALQILALDNLTVSLSGWISGGAPVPITSPGSLAVALSGSIGGVIPVAVTNTSLPITTSAPLTVSLSGSFGGIIPVAVTNSITADAAIGVDEGTIGSGSVVAVGVVDGGGFVWTWNNVEDAEANTGGKRIGAAGHVLYDGARYRAARDAYAASGGVGLPAAGIIGRDYEGATWRPVGVNSRSEMQTAAVGVSTVISVTGTITAGTYAEKDSIGGKWTFPNAVRYAGGKGYIQTITVTDKARASGAIDLVFYGDDLLTTVTDADPIALMDGDLLKIVGEHEIPNTGYRHFVDNAFYSRSGLGIEFQCVGTTLYCTPMARNTPTYETTSDLTITLAVMND